jgi:hypothetical protein
MLNKYGLPGWKNIRSQWACIDRSTSRNLLPELCSVGQIWAFCLAEVTSEGVNEYLIERSTSDAFDWNMLNTSNMDYLICAKLKRFFLNVDKKLLRNDGVSINWCYATKTSFFPLAISHSKNHGNGRFIAYMTAPALYIIIINGRRRGVLSKH